MLKDLTADNIYIVCGHTDMRKSIDGLAVLVQQQFQLDLFASSAFRLKLSITLDTLTARILKLSSDSQSRIEPVPFYSWWDATDRRADSAVAPVAHEISPDHRF